MEDKHQRTIESLQRELQAVEPANPLVKDHIDRLNNELNQYVSNPNRNKDELPALQSSIEQAIESFEGHHPNLTEALRVAINTLVNAGI